MKRFKKPTTLHNEIALIQIPVNHRIEHCPHAPWQPREESVRRLLHHSGPL